MSESHIKKLSTLSNTSIFRLLISILWTSYDAGGVSVGRSYQAHLLEGFMDFFPIEDSRDNVDLSNDIIIEARCRIKKGAQKLKVYEAQLELPFRELEVLSNTEFALLSLNEMYRWWLEEAESLGFFNSLWKLYILHIRDVCKIAYPDISYRRLHLARFDTRSITEESYQRRLRVWRRSERLRDFEEFGINPWNEKHAFF